MPLMRQHRCRCHRGLSTYDDPPEVDICGDCGCDPCSLDMDLDL